MRTVSLRKGEQQFVFRYVPGNEPEVLDAVSALADSPDSALDWFDAACLSFQIAHEQAARCMKVMGPAQYEEF